MRCAPTRFVSRCVRPVVAVLALAALAGCCSTGRYVEVSAAEFLRAAGSPTGSARHVEFIGVAGGRAYLLEWTASVSSRRGCRDVLAVDLEALPADLRARLLSGENPWAR